MEIMLYTISNKNRVTVPMLHNVKEEFKLNEIGKKETLFYLNFWYASEKKIFHFLVKKNENNKKIIMKKKDN